MMNVIFASLVNKSAAVITLLGVAAITFSAVPASAATTDDRASRTPVLIESDSGDATSPQIAFDRSGNALAVWVQSVGPTNYIWSSRYTARGGWSAATVMSRGGASAPRIAMDTNGNALALWCEFDGVRNNIRSRNFSFISGWAVNADLITNEGDASSPQLAFDAAGGALVVWSQSDGTQTHIWSRRRIPRGGWDAAKQLETNAGDALAPQIAVDVNGTALAVWYQFDGVRNNIWSNLFTGTEWDDPVLIEENAGDAFAPQIAKDGNGNALAVWYQFGDGGNHIWSNRYTRSSWGDAAPLETNAGDASTPQIAMNGGDALAVWYQFDGIRNNIWSNRYSVSTDRWEGAVLIETDNWGDAFSPDVAVGSSGNALVVWHQKESIFPYFGVRAARYTFGTRGWSMTPVEHDHRGSAFLPRVVFDQNTAVVVWYQSDGTRNNIWSSRLE